VCACALGRPRTCQRYCFHSCQQPTHSHTCPHMRARTCATQCGHVEERAGDADGSAAEGAAGVPLPHHMCVRTSRQRVRAGLCSCGWCQVRALTKHTLASHCTFIANQSQRATKSWPRSHTASWGSECVLSCVSALLCVLASSACDEVCGHCSCGCFVGRVHALTHTHTHIL
jgi:hypothetical protein